ncbi:MAG TPA: hypothetical protein VMU90_09705, partial [Solirubrobacteraceae bacterium]|nr:hypothetical protein [Solirubrobacteraceae bacterium]
SQLQLAFVKIGGEPSAPGSEEPGQTPPSAGPEPAGSGQPEPEGPATGEAGPAQRSGRLWVPGQ